MGKIKRGNREIIVKNKTGVEKHYLVPLTLMIPIPEADKAVAMAAIVSVLIISSPCQSHFSNLYYKTLYFSAVIQFYYIRRKKSTMYEICRTTHYIKTGR